MQACRSRLGDSTSAPTFKRANISDYESRGYTVIMEFGLLTEAEFEDLVGHKPSAVKATPTSLPSQTGKKHPMFLVTLEGLSCDKIHCMRRIQMKTTCYLTNQEMLLEAARQIHESQPQNVFEYNYEQLLKDNPVGMKDATGYRKNLKSIAELQQGEIEEVDLGTVAIDVDAEASAPALSRRVNAAKQKAKVSRKRDLPALYLPSPGLMCGFSN